MTTRLSLLVAATMMLVVTSVSVARAADELGLSADGVTWSPSLNQPLFDSSQLWVPGDSETARFYVRNQGGTPADLTIDILGSTTSDLFDTGDLHVTATGGGGNWVTVSERGEHRLLTRPDLSDGAAVPIDVTVVLDADSTNVSQFRSAELDFRVTLTEVVAGGTGTDGGSTDDDGSGGSPLPGIGSTVSGWFLPVGALLLGLGLALVFAPAQREVGAATCLSMPAPRRRLHRLWRTLLSARLRAVLSLGLVLGLGSAGTLAFWTDDVEISGTTFTAGSLDLQVNNEADDDYATTTLSMTGANVMIPGSSSAEVLTVQNKGNIPLKYTMTGGMTGTDAAAVAPQLTLTIRAGGSRSGTGNTSTCTGGTSIYNSPLTATTSTAIIATARGPLAATVGTEGLCFQVTLSSSAPSSLQTKTANATFTLTGTSDLS